MKSTILYYVLLFAVLVFSMAMCKDKGSSDKELLQWNGGWIPQGKWGAEGNFEGEANSDGDADGDGDGDMDGDADVDIDGDSDIDTDTDSDIDTDNDTDMDDAVAITSPQQLNGVVPTAVLPDPVTLYLSSDDSNSQSSPVIIRSMINSPFQTIIPRDVIRIWEFLNYYSFAYALPESGEVLVDNY